MKKIVIRWIIVLSGFYNFGHILFGFDETPFISRITHLIEAIFFGSILLYIFEREKTALLQ
ncbi:hypothetical protein CWS01_14200 [Niallia nealsonii]|uniref:Uncharacterized protein n=1 Tax=Niallia nealsonii TaxID=115979 RepID=A0A2N0YZZ3_9BACI|nr:hypothetical protein CWS01_14200 [Niallia nealsonii]